MEVEEESLMEGTLHGDGGWDGVYLALKIHLLVQEGPSSSCNVENFISKISMCHVYVLVSYRSCLLLVCFGRFSSSCSLSVAGGFGLQG